MAGGLPKVGVQLVAEDADGFKRALEDSDKAVGKFGDGAEKAGRGVSSFGQVAIGALREVGAAAVNLAVEGGKALLGFIKDSVSAAGDFEAGMNNFAAVAGGALAESGQSLDQFKDLFIQLGRELPVSTAEVQQAATEMIKGGIEPATIAAGGLRTVLQFAAAGGLSLADAATIAAKAIGGWISPFATAKEKADFLTHSTDELTRAANASTVDVDELALGLYNVQGTAKLAGVSFDETVTTLAQLAPSFSSASDAGTSFKTFLARLQPATAPASEAMSRLGLVTEEGTSKFYDAQGSFIGMSAAAELLHTATVGLTEAQREQALQTIFGNDGIRAAAVLAQDGAAGYDAMGAALAKQNGVAEVAAQKQQGFNTAMENAKGSIEALQITIGSQLLPVLSELLDNYIAPLINAFTSLASGDTFTFFTTLGGMIGEINPKLGAFVVSLGLASDPLATLKQAVIDNIPGLKDLIAFGNTPFGETLKRGATVVATYFSGQFLTDVGGAVTSTQTKLDAFGKSEWGQTLKRGAAVVGDYFSGPWQEEVGRGLAGVKKGLDVIADSPWWTRLKSDAGDLGTFMETEFPGAFQRGFDKVKTAISTAVADAQAKVDDFTNTFSRGVDEFKRIWADYDWAAVGKSVIDGIIQGIKSGTAALASAAASAGQALLDAAMNAIQGHSPSRLAEELIGKSFDEGAALGVINNIPVMEDAARQLGAAALDTMGQIGEDVRYLWAEAMKVAGQDGEQAFLDKIKSMGAEAKKLLADAIKDALSLAAATPRTLADTRDFVRGIFDSGHFNEEMDKAGGPALQKLAQETTAAFNTAFEQSQKLGALDPKAAKDYYDFRIKQIEEIAKLEQQMIAARDAQERGAIKDRLDLVLTSQAAARDQFLNGIQGTAGAGATAAISAYLGGINDSALAGVGSQNAGPSYAVQSSSGYAPPATPGQLLAGAGAGGSSASTTNYNYSPSYAAAPRNPSQDFALMQAWNMGST